ncbi:MAG TPA: hypothetical protein VKS60_10875, partial [Stellaceae bacterium]|nr:hypothetical protein [Stellaceae bacterium]
MIRKTIFALLATTALAACTSPVGPQDSGVGTPAAWSRLAGQDPSPVLASTDTAEIEQRWWQSFGD